MLKLLTLRERIKELYSTRNRFADQIIRFLIVLISMIIINVNIGAFTILKNPLVVIAVSVLGAFLPKNLSVMMVLLLMVVHIFAISPMAAVVVLITYVIMYLLFFRFASKQTYVLLATPLLFMLKLPFVMPIILGLSATPIAIIPVTFGTLIYFYLNYFSINFEQLLNAGQDEAISMMTGMAENVFKNPTFFYTVGTFALVICLVYFVKRLTVDYSWIISSIAGGLLSTLAILIGCIIFDMSSVYSIPMVIIGGLISTGVAWLAQMFLHSVDYVRTEYTQFEDDEYYYYVKAVPKIQVLPAEKSIKRINAQKVSTKTKANNKKSQNSEAKPTVKKI